MRINFARRGLQEAADFQILSTEAMIVDTKHGLIGGDDLRKDTAQASRWADFDILEVTRL